MEFVSLRFMEEVIENVFFRAAEHFSPNYNTCTNTWTESVYFSQLPIWSNVAVDVSRRNRYVRLSITFPGDGTEDNVLSYESVKVHDIQHLTWAKGRLEDLPLKRNILIDIKDAWRYRGCRTEELFKLFEKKNLQFSSSTQANFRKSFREEPEDYGLFLEMLRKGATVNFPEDFTLSELVDLKRKHGLARHQLNLRRVTADDQDLPALLEALPECTFEEVIFKTVAKARYIVFCKSQSVHSTLTITSDPKNAAAILQVLTAREPCSIEFIKTGATTSDDEDFNLSELADLKRKHGVGRNQLYVYRASANDQDLDGVFSAIPEFTFEHFIINTLPTADDLHRLHCVGKYGLSTLKITAEPQNAAVILQFLAHRSCSLEIVADLRLCRELSQCERSRAALKGQKLCIKLNCNDIESFRFVFETFDSSLVVQAPECCACNNPYNSDSCVNRSHSFRQSVWRLADETRNIMTTDRRIGVLCGCSYWSRFI